MQGMAHGKVGDVVFSRVNGEQVARVYNRNPHDARTHKQLYQRAIMATCMQAYSAGKAIFDHSWERKRVGQDCQSEFMRRNLKELRTQLAYEINEDVFANDCKAHCIWPGAKVPVANEYIISDGSYPQDIIQETIYLGEMQYLLPVPNDGESVAQYASRVGLVPDDFFTFGVFLEGTTELYKETPEEENPENIGYDCHFGYCRLHVKSNITQIATVVEDWKDIFDIDASENVRLTWFDEYGLEGPVDLKSLDPERRGVGAIGLIRSHKNSKLRSKSTMYCPSWGTLPTNVFGLNRMSILEAWIAGTPSLGDSDYILEGGGGSQPTPTPEPQSRTGIYLYTDAQSWNGYSLIYYDEENDTKQVLSNIYGGQNRYACAMGEDVTNLNPCILLGMNGGTEPSASFTNYDKETALSAVTTYLSVVQDGSEYSIMVTVGEDDYVLVTGLTLSQFESHANVAPNIPIPVWTD